MPKAVKRRKPFEYLAIDGHALSVFLDIERRSFQALQRLREPRSWELEFGPLTGDNFTLKVQLATKGKLLPRIREAAQYLADYASRHGLLIKLFSRPTATTLEYRVSASDEERFRTLLLRGREARLTAELDDFFGKSPRARVVLAMVESAFGKSA